MITFLDYLGTAVFAITGALVAARLRMDVFGMLVVAFVTAVGGGTIRDLVLGFRPVFWVAQPEYVVIIVLAAIAAFAMLRLFARPSRLLLGLDALGLAVFTVLGCQRTLQVTDSLPIVVMMGIMSGSAGGIIRDVLCGKVPVIFRSELYATAALIGGVIFVLMTWGNIQQDIVTLVAATAVLAVRLAALRWHLTLPIAPD